MSTITVSLLRARLAQREQEADNAILQMYVELRRNIDEQVTALAQEIASQDDVRPSKLRQMRRYQALIAQLDQEMARVREGLGPTLEALRSDAIDLSGLSLIGVDSTELVRLPNRELQDLVARRMGDTALNRALRNLETDAADSVFRALSAGIATGANPAQIARRITNALGGNMSRAMTIARTEMNQAFRSGALLNYRENHHLFDGWVWTAAVASSPRPCPACFALHGRVFPLTEDMVSHPNCRCAPAPKLSGEDVPFPTGEELFETLTPEQQLQVLGPKGYQAFKDGLVRLSDFPRRDVGPYGSGWTPTSVDQAIETPAELPAASPETFPSIEPAEMLQLYGDSDVWRERQTPEEFRALGSYAGSGYRKINSQLREATIDSDTAELVDGLDSLMRKSAAPTNMTVWRGTSLRRLENFQVGDIMTDLGYVSTSIRKSVADELAAYRKGGIVEIRVPEGSPGIYVEGQGFGIGNNEYEWLLPRGTQFRVVEVTTSINPLTDQEMPHIIVELVSNANDATLERAGQIGDAQTSIPESEVEFSPTTDINLKRAALKAGWRLKLTDDQKLLLGQYQSLGYETVNGSLRGTARIPLSEEQLVRHTDALDSAIDAFPLPENIIVYRATSQFSGANVGDVITDMGYVSTTINPDVLSQHLHRSPGRQMVEIRLPAGTKGAYLDALNPISEFEVLLARGSQFRVVEILPDRVVVEYVGNVNDATLETPAELPAASPEAFETLSDADLRQMYESWAATLDDADRAALLEYQGPSFARFNGYLRGTVTRERLTEIEELRRDLYDEEFSFDEAFERIDAALARGSTSQPMIVYRGTAAELFDGVEVGQIVTDAAYISSTLNKKAAEEYAHRNSRDPDRPGIVVVIEVPAGTPGAYLNAATGDSKFAIQEEFLFPRGSQFEVVSRSDGEIVVRYVGNVRDAQTSIDEPASEPTPEPAPEPTPEPTPFEESEFAQQFEDLAKNLTFDQRKWALAYQESGHKWINSMLRGKEVPSKIRASDRQDAVQYLDELTSLGRAPRSGILYRATRVGDVKVGDILTDAGYVSTSQSVSTAQFFALKPDYKIVKILVDENTPGFWIDAIRTVDEKEFLLPRGSQFEVVEITSQEITVRYVGNVRDAQASTDEPTIPTREELDNFTRAQGIEMFGEERWRLYERERITYEELVGIKPIDRLENDVRMANLLETHEGPLTPEQRVVALEELTQEAYDMLPADRQLELFGDRAFRLYAEGRGSFAITSRIALQDARKAMRRAPRQLEPTSPPRPTPPPPAPRPSDGILIERFHENLPDETRALLTSQARRFKLVADLNRKLKSGADVSSEVATMDRMVRDFADTIGLNLEDYNGLRIDYKNEGAIAVKDPQCFIEFDSFAIQLLSDRRQFDDIIATVIHEALHARQPFTEDFRVEIGYFPGFEEGLVALLDRRFGEELNLRRKNLAYTQWVTMYQNVADRLGMTVDDLARALITSPPGAVRRAMHGLIRERLGDDAEEFIRQVDTWATPSGFSLPSNYDALGTL